MNKIAKNATLCAIELRKIGGEKNALTAAAFDECAAEIERLQTLLVDIDTTLGTVADELKKLRGAS